jgi:GNAT superfamily N-acetyltransferase
MSDGGISYHWFNPRGNKELIRHFVSCHEEVIRPEIEDKWKKCRVCNESWGKGKESFLESVGFRHCGIPVADVWSADNFVAYIFSKINPTNGATCWLACNSGNNVVGYCWGFIKDINALEEDLDAPGLTRFIERKFGNFETVAFQDRIGVLEAYRKNGIATALFSRRLESFVESGAKVGVSLLSRKTSSFVFDWYKSRGYVSVYDFKDADKSIIIARSLDGLIL